MAISFTIPMKKWFAPPADESLPEGILDPDNALTATELIDLQSGNAERGICAPPFTRQSDQHTVYNSDKHHRQPVRF